MKKTFLAAIEEFMTEYYESFKSNPEIEGKI